MSLRTYIIAFIATVVVALAGSTTVCAQTRAAIVDGPDKSVASKHYVSSRAPLATGEFHKTATRRRRPKRAYYRTLSCNAMELRIGDRRRFPPRHENDAQALARRQLSIHLRERPSRVQGKGCPHSFVADR